MSEGEAAAGEGAAASADHGPDKARSSKTTLPARLYSYENDKGDGAKHHLVAYMQREKETDK